MINQRPRYTKVRYQRRAPAINWWQLATIVFATLSLCACQSQAPQRHRGAIPSSYHGEDSGAAMPNPMQQGMPPSQPAGVPFGALMGGGPMPVGPMPREPMSGGQTSGGVIPASYGQMMPGMRGPCCPQPVADSVFCDCGQGCAPLPHRPDEYLCDGGDQYARADLDRNGAIRGLNVEDTVASYECHTGQIQIEPSNRVCIYAPRFASVRKVDGAISSDQIDQVAGVDAPLAIVRQRESLKPGAAMQPTPPVIEIANRKAVAFREHLKAEGILERVWAVSTQDALMPYEDFSIIRVGIAQQGEKPRLAQKAQAAIVWSRDQGLNVIIDKKRAQAEESVESAMQTYGVEEPECPKLRVCKVASTSDALPGEEVDFTIRFDNVGHSPAKNVVLYDNLTTRLEYVPNSAQASVKAKFYSQLNEADSLVLKWTIDEPIEPGHGGIVRFRCKVR